jgi:hypothetical protein
MEPDDDIIIWVPQAGELWKFDGNLMLIVGTDEEEIEFFDCNSKEYRKISRSLMNAVLQHAPEDVCLVLKKSNISRT